MRQSILLSVTLFLLLSSLGSISQKTDGSTQAGFIGPESIAYPLDTSLDKTMVYLGLENKSALLKERSFEVKSALNNNASSAAFEAAYNFVKWSKKIQDKDTDSFTDSLVRVSKIEHEILSTKSREFVENKLEPIESEVTKQAVARAKRARSNYNQRINKTLSKLKQETAGSKNRIYAIGLDSCEGGGMWCTTKFDVYTLNSGLEPSYSYKQRQGGGSWTSAGYEYIENTIDNKTVKYHNSITAKEDKIAVQGGLNYTVYKPAYKLRINNKLTDNYRAITSGASTYANTGSSIHHPLENETDLETPLFSQPNDISSSISAEKLK